MKKATQRSIALNQTSAQKLKNDIESFITSTEVEHAKK